MYSQEQIQDSINKLKDALGFHHIINAELARVGAKYASGAPLRTEEQEILDMILLLSTEPQAS
jgi:hypothetical protein